MITLTNPKLVNSILGGTATVAYDKFVLDQIRYITTGSGTVTANVRITSTSQPNMQAIQGSLKIELATSLLTIEVAQLDFFRQITLTAGQVSSISALIIDAQNALENGLVTVGVVAGTQSTGTLQ